MYTNKVIKKNGNTKYHKEGKIGAEGICKFLCQPSAQRYIYGKKGAYGETRMVDVGIWIQKTWRHSYLGARSGCNSGDIFSLRDTNYKLK